MNHLLGIQFRFQAIWPAIGGGWAVVAAVLISGFWFRVPEIWLSLVGLWLLVDVILGSLWRLLVEEEALNFDQQAVPVTSDLTGIVLPYAQPGSMAARVGQNLRFLQHNQPGLLTTVVLLSVLGPVAGFGLNPILGVYAVFVVGLALWWGGLGSVRRPASILLTPLVVFAGPYLITLQFLGLDVSTLSGQVWGIGVFFSLLAMALFGLESHSLSYRLLQVIVIGLLGMLLFWQFPTAAMFVALVLILIHLFHQPEAGTPAQIQAYTGRILPWLGLALLVCAADVGGVL